MLNFRGEISLSFRKAQNHQPQPTSAEEIALSHRGTLSARAWKPRSNRKARRAGCRNSDMVQSWATNIFVYANLLLAKMYYGDKPAILENVMENKKTTWNSWNLLNTMRFGSELVHSHSLTIWLDAYNRESVSFLKQNLESFTDFKAEGMDDLPIPMDLLITFNCMCGLNVIVKYRKIFHRSGSSFTVILPGEQWESFARMRRQPETCQNSKHFQSLKVNDWRIEGKIWVSFVSNFNFEGNQ